LVHCNSAKFISGRGKILMNMALEGLNLIISYFSNSGFWDVAPYTDSSVKEAPVQGVGFGSRNREGMSRR